jgi:drug/metabolite transporter (DMT)-like permease
VASTGASPLALAFWRDLVTGACLFLGLALIRPELLRVERRDLPWLAALGIVGVGTFHTLWNVNIMRMGYGVATVLLYASPAFVALASRLAWGEPLTRAKLLAIVLTFAGCALAAGLDELDAVALTGGNLALGLVAAASFGSFTLFGRQVAGRCSPWTVLAYGFGFGALALLPLQFVAPPPLGGQPPWPVPPDAWLWFGSLLLVATIVPFVLYLVGLRTLPASVASLLITSEVVFAAAIGYVVFGESMRFWQVVGAGLVVAGVTLIVMQGRGETGT